MIWCAILLRSWTRCDVDPDKLSAPQPDDDQDVEQVEANGRNHEQVHVGEFGAWLRRKVSQRCESGPRRLAADEGFTGFNGSLERAIGVRADITQARRFDTIATIQALQA